MPEEQGNKHPSTQTLSDNAIGGYVTAPRNALRDAHKLTFPAGQRHCWANSAANVAATMARKCRSRETAYEPSSAAD